MFSNETTIARPLALHVKSNERFYPTVKRLIDVVFATLLLVLFCPILLWIALAIRLNSPGPILFKQIRVGQNRRRLNRRNCTASVPSNYSEKRTSTDRRKQDLSARYFTFYKFRTMYHNADPEIHRQYVHLFIHNQLPESDSASTSDSSIFKLDCDKRITRVGRILRRTSLDELPQLFNILKGDMSLVGPRPPLPYEVVEYQEWHKGRLQTMPGLTGWWQVRGRSQVSFDEMVRMDIYYAEHQSLMLDFLIILLTPWAMISGKGAQ